VTILQQTGELSVAEMIVLKRKPTLVKSLGQSVHLANESEFCDIIVAIPLPPEGNNSAKASDKIEKSVGVKPLKTFIGE